MMALGIHTDSEPVGTTDFSAGQTFKVYDRTEEARQPILIRISNLGTEPIKYAEDLGTCNANVFTDVIAGGTDTDTGDGGKIEFKNHRPKNIYIYGANAYRCKITKRYGPEN